MEDSGNPVQQDDSTGFPLIGVISIPASNMFDTQYHKAQANFSYIPVSYVKYISQTGAMAVLIPFDLPIKTLDKLLDSVNGIQLIGGDADFGTDEKPSFFQQRVHHIMKRAIEKNESGIYYPILGTCLGM